MTPSTEHIAYLWKQYLAKNASREELEELFTALRTPELDPDLLKTLEAEMVSDPLTHQMEETDRRAILNEILKGPAISVQPHTAYRTMRPWIRFAAASVLLLFALGVYFYLHEKPTVPVIVKTHDISAPSTAKAMLTLSNGNKIILDSVRIGSLAVQGNTDIIKLSDGKIIYKGPSADDKIDYNLLEVPRGSKIVNITLSDGTKVWINSASSLRYPVAFNGKERRIFLTGEAYFEVMHNPKLPFRVEVINQVIEDVGTSFNVNAYADEIDIRTTLLEGSVKIKEGNQTQLLKPGDQGITNLQMKNQIRVTRDIDMNKIMAWKNGWFEFDQSSLNGIMRQVSRWYNVDVMYEGNPNSQKYWGRISKELPLSSILQSLEANGKGLKFNVDGTKLIVHQ